MAYASPKTSEWLTRKKMVDKRLTDAGWRIVPDGKFEPTKPLAAYNGCAIEEYPTDNGPADYALCAEGIVLAVIEAKKLTLGPQNVLSQAERYAMGAHRKTLGLPRLWCSFSLLQKLRVDLAPRHPPRAQPLATGRAVSHAGRSG